MVLNWHQMSLRRSQKAPKYRIFMQILSKMISTHMRSNYFFSPYLRSQTRYLKSGCMSIFTGVTLPKKCWLPFFSLYKPTASCRNKGYQKQDLTSLVRRQNNQHCLCPHTSSVIPYFWPLIFHSCCCYFITLCCIIFHLPTSIKSMACFRAVVTDHSLSMLL